MRKSYIKVRGRVSRVLVYSHVITGRFSLGRKEALCYGEHFPKDKIGILMNIAKYTAFLLGGVLLICCDGESIIDKI